MLPLVVFDDLFCYVTIWNGKKCHFRQKIMNQGKYVFAQLTEFLPRRKFDGIVEKYQGNKYIKGLTCWNQMLIMVFGQLTSRKSMQDLMWA